MNTVNLYVMVKDGLPCIFAGADILFRMAEGADPLFAANVAHLMCKTADIEFDPETLEARQQSFPITSVSRPDLIDTVGSEEKAQAIDDADMEDIADKMNKDYLDQLYWSSLNIIAPYVLKLEDEEPEDDDEDND